MHNAWLNYVMSLGSRLVSSGRLLCAKATFELTHIKANYNSYSLFYFLKRKVPDNELLTTDFRMQAELQVRKSPIFI